MSELVDHDRRWRPGPVLFAAAVVGHIALLRALGPSAVVSPSLDANVYLELAQTLWREGRYETVLGKTYPPAYPMLIAPLFALDDNGLRFTLVYVLHGLLLAGGALALLPLARELAGERRAWLVLTASQLLAGVTVHAVHPRTETLFTALAMVAVALVHRLARRPGVEAAVMLGATLGLMVATRRTGLAFAGAGVAVLAARVVASRGTGRLREELRTAALVGLGALAGLAPELFVTALQGEAVQAYGDGVVGRHLGAGVDAIRRPEVGRIAIQVGAQHLSYFVLSTGGLALLVPVALGKRGAHLSPGVRAAAWFTALAGLGLALLSTLHVVRYWVRRDLEKGFDLYARYVDPLEPVWVILGFGVACALAGAGRLRATAPWLAAAAITAYSAGGVYRPRGYRLPWPDHVEERLHWPGSPEHFLQVVTFAVLVLLAVALSRRLAERPGALVVVIAVGWLISAHLVVNWVRYGAPNVEIPAVLVEGPLAEAPRADVAVAVGKDRKRKHVYALPFKTDHRISLIEASTAPDWRREHPEGFVVTRASERRIPRAGDPVTVGDWKVYLP